MRIKKHLTELHYIYFFQMSKPELIEKESKHVQGLDSPVFCDNEIALKEKDAEKITRF